MQCLQTRGVAEYTVVQRVVLLVHRCARVHGHSGTIECAVESAAERGTIECAVECGTIECAAERGTAECAVERGTAECAVESAVAGQVDR